MLDDAPPLLDLVLIFFLSFLLWALERAWNFEVGTAEVRPPEEVRPAAGRKFLWRCKVDEGNAKIEIWTAQDSTSSRP